VAAPSAGNVTTDDVADCMIGCVYALLGENHDELFNRLAQTRLRGSQHGGLPLRGPEQPNVVPVADARARMSAATKMFAVHARRRRFLSHVNAPARVPGDAAR
jgi:hypothetical protein